MTKHPDLFAALAAPFDQAEVKDRSQGSRKVYYITARTAMNRLDSVLGPENWWDAYGSAGDSSVECRLTIRLPDGSTLTKCDAGGCAGMTDAGDDDKSAVSDAFKRAAVKFGVARYLYRDGVPTFVQERTPATSAEAPAEPLGRPAGGNGKHPKERREWSGAANAGGKGADPVTGKALFAWCRDREQETQAGLIKYLQGWAKLQEFPGRMVDWDRDQVALGLAEARRKLETIGAGPD